MPIDPTLASYHRALSSVVEYDTLMPREAGR
jgi:hypothetical protein